MKQLILDQVSQGITKDNYYSILGSLNNLLRPNQDIVTFTGFMDWNEKFAHLNHYLKELDNE